MMQVHKMSYQSRLGPNDQIQQDPCILKVLKQQNKAKLQCVFSRLCSLFKNRNQHPFLETHYHKCKASVLSYHGQFSSLITYFPCFLCILYFPKAYLSRIASQLPGIYKMLPSSLNLTLPKFWQVLQEFKLMRSFSISKAVFTLSLFSSTQSKQLFFPLKVDNLTEAYEIRVLQTLICSFSSASEHA